MPWVSWRAADSVQQLALTDRSDRSLSSAAGQHEAHLRCHIYTQLHSYPLVTDTLLEPNLARQLKCRFKTNLKPILE